MSRFSFARRVLPVSLLGAALLLPATATALSPPRPGTILSLDTLAGPTAGGTVVEFRGYWSSAVEQVTFDGVPASFTLTDGRLVAVTPPHAAAENVPVTVTSAPQSGLEGLTSTYVGFDYEGPKAPGAVERTISYTCEPSGNGNAGAVISVRVQLRTPQQVLPGEPFSIADWKSTVFIGRDGTSGLRVSIEQFSPRLEVSGTTVSQIALAPGPESSQTIFTPIAFDSPAAGFAPEQFAGTVTAPAGGAVTVAAPSFSLVTFDRMLPGSQRTLTCAAADSVILSVPVTQAPVLPAPVVERVAGSAFAGFGGLLLVTGANLRSATSVAVGRGTARIVARYRGGLFVLAPKLPAGRYPVSVTTRVGTSAPSDQAAVTYRRVF